MICDKCSFETKNATDLRQHITKYHTENLFQGLELQSTEFANSTNKNNEQLTIFECAECDYKTNLQTELTEHDSTKHIFECKECSYYIDNLVL